MPYIGYPVKTLGKHINRWRLRPSIAVVGLALLAGGCAAFNKLGDQYIVDAAVVPNEDHPVSGGTPPRPINLDCFYFPEDLRRPDQNPSDKCEGWRKPANDATKTAYQKVLDSTKVQQVLRNRLIDELVWRSDEICHIHKGHILSNSSAFDLATGAISGVLDTVAGVVGGSGPISAAAASVGIVGTQVRANIYKNILAPAVIRKIDKLRRDKLKLLEDKRKDSYADYPISRALRDFNVYHYECSFFRGIQELAEGTRVVPLTRTEIDEEITTLEKENEGLAKKFSSLTLIQIDQKPVTRMAYQQWTINYARITSLRHQRASAPRRKTPKSSDDAAKISWNTDAATLTTKKDVDSLIEIIEAEIKNIKNKLAKDIDAAEKSLLNKNLAARQIALAKAKKRKTALGN